MDKSWRHFQERLRGMDERDEDRVWLGALGVVCLTGALALMATIIFGG